MTKPLRTWWHELNTWEPDAARAFYGRTLGWSSSAWPCQTLPNTGLHERKESLWVAYLPSASPTIPAFLHTG